MLEASSLRSRKHPLSPTDTRHSSNTPTTITTAKEKLTTAPTMSNNSGTLISSSGNKLSDDSTAVVTEPKSAVSNGLGNHDDVDMKEASPSGATLPSLNEEAQSDEPLSKSDARGKLSAEDISGGLLDGALDDMDEMEDVDDEDVDDTEDTEIAHGADDVTERQDGDDEEGIEEEVGDDDDDDDDGKHDEEDDIIGGDEANEELASGNVDDTETPHSEDQEDGDVAMAEHETEGEDEGTPAAHTEDEESEDLEEEGSHAEDEDEDGDGDAEEDEEDEQPPKPEVKKDATSYPQKPTLNRPQLIEEELKDSGDELSDLSEFDDTDDSDEELTERSPANGKAGSNMSTATSSAVASRPALGRRKRSLREMSRESKEQDDNVKRVSKGNEEANEQHSDKESESEAPEGEDAEEEKADGADEADEEEDLERKQLHMDALEALTTIEVGFATLRDKMYDERMLELDREVEMIDAGTHPELSTLMREIEDKREQRLRIAKAWRTHMGEIAQCEFEIKEYQAHCTFQSKKRDMRNDIITDLGKRKRRVMLELTLASDSRRKNALSDKLSLIRARKHRRAEVSELRAIKEQYGFPASMKPAMISAAELDEDFGALGLSRPIIQSNASEHGIQHHGRSFATISSSSPRPMNATIHGSAPRWGGGVSSEYTSPSNHARAEVEIFVEGNRCKVDGIWYKPNDAVAVLDASIGQYSAKYLFVANDEIMLQKMDGSKTRIHINLFRARKLYMQPRP
ncbi:hypothetical protein BGZ98_001803 [Dissophora globulifera]|nr:hypothetical protein BGZ98_001803 [Dissophora globulifera]